LKRIIPVIKKKNIRIIYLSTISLYPENTFVPITENYKIDNHKIKTNAYLYSKFLAEREITKKIKKTNYLILRLGAIYGLSNSKNILDKFIHKYKQKKTIKVYTPLNIKFNFLHIKQLIYCINFLINSKKHGTYNVGNYKYITLDTLIKKLKEKFNSIKFKFIKNLNYKKKYYINYKCTNLKKIKYRFWYDKKICIY
jgi:nucleoside-diphosphate-sugar epimerase